MLVFLALPLLVVFLTLWGLCRTLPHSPQKAYPWSVLNIVLSKWFVIQSGVSNLFWMLSFWHWTGWGRKWLHRKVTIKNKTPTLVIEFLSQMQVSSIPISTNQKPLGSQVRRYQVVTNFHVACEINQVPSFVVIETWQEQFLLLRLEFARFPPCTGTYHVFYTNNGKWNVYGRVNIIFVLV